MVASNSIHLVRGKDGDYTLFLIDSCNRPIDITGWTFILIRHASDGGETTIDAQTPLEPGSDEVQSIAYNTVPDAGTFKIKIGPDTTTALAFDAALVDIENAINALARQDGVTVSGDFSSAHQVTFAGGSGKRDQPTIEIVENSLVTGVNAVVVGVTVNAEGTPMSGIDVTDEKCGALKVYLSEEETTLLKKGKSQDIDVCVRVGSRDLNIPILRKVLNVEASPFE